MNEKVEVDDIIGLIKTDEQTDSVALKKEAQLSICEKRVMELEKEIEELQKERNYFERKKTEYLVSLNGCRLMNTQLQSEIKDLNDVLARYEEKNEQLKSEIEKLSYANEDLLSEKRNWEKLSDEYAKVYEENEQLKQQLADDFNQSNCITVQKSKIKELEKENEQLKIQNKMLSDELEQCKAVIDKRWSEYLEKKGDDVE